MQSLLKALTPKDILFIVPDPVDFDNRLRALISDGTPFENPQYPKATEHAITSLETNLELAGKELLASHAKDAQEKQQAEALLAARRLELTMLRQAVTLNSGDASAAEAYKLTVNDMYGNVDDQLLQPLFQSERDWLESYASDSKNVMKVRDELLAMWPQTKAKAQTGFSPSQLDTAKKLVEDYYRDLTQAVTGPQYGPRQLSILFNRVFDRLGYSEFGWKAQVIPDALNLSVSVGDKLLKVSPHSHGDQQTIIQKTLHEIGVHVRRAVTAEKHGSLLLQLGLAQYQKGEEGLGIAIEAAWAGSEKTQSLERARRRYLYQGLGLGRDGGKPRTFTEVYEFAWRREVLLLAAAGSTPEANYEEAKYQAGLHVFRHFRGTPCNLPGVLFTKDHVYFEGYFRTMQQLIDNPTQQQLDLLTSGRFNHLDSEQRAFAKRYIK